MPEEERVTVRLPKELVGRVTKETGQRFASVDDSVTFILERALRKEAEASTPQAEFSNEEKKAIEDRLKSLGYF